MDRESYVNALKNERSICVQQDKPDTRIAAIDAELDRFGAAPEKARAEKAVPSAGK